MFSGESECLRGIWVIGAILGKIIGRGESRGKDSSYSLITISSSIYFSFPLGKSFTILNFSLGFRVNWMSSLLLGDLALLSWLSVKFNEIAGWSRFYFEVNNNSFFWFYSLASSFYKISAYGYFLKNLLTALFFCFLSATISLMASISDFPWVGSRIFESIISTFEDWKAIKSLSVRTSLRFSLTWDKLYY